MNTPSIIPERLAELPTITLDKGAHRTLDKGACAMEVVSWLAGEGFTDAPQCASPVLGTFARSLNDVETAAGQTRMHCETGPAIAWEDGFALHFWHGTRVPADLIETGWDVERIMREDNAEIRRCAIERMGWDEFTCAARLVQVGDSVPDPGNPGQALALYDLPGDVYGEPVRVLLCTNATVERDGTRHRFGLTVPAEIADPITAAAWTFDVPVTAYRSLERAT